MPKHLKDEKLDKRWQDIPPEIFCMVKKELLKPVIIECPGCDKVINISEGDEECEMIYKCNYCASECCEYGYEDKFNGQCYICNEPICGECFVIYLQYEGFICRKCLSHEHTFAMTRKKRGYSFKYIKD